MAVTATFDTDLDRAAAFARDPGLVPSLTAAIERAAIAVMAEEATVSGHDMRTMLARQVLVDPSAYVQRFAWAVSVNDTITTQWANGDVAEAISGFQFQVNSVWDALAGVIKEPAPAPAA